MVYLISVRSSETDEIQERFRAGGIPVFLEPDYSRVDMVTGIATVFRNATTGPAWYRVYVCLDDQLQEAKRLLSDANYKVTKPVDVAKFEATMDRLGANRKVGWRLSDKNLNWIVGIIVVAFVLWILRVVIAS
jgi:hypothetical protein